MADKSDWYLSLQEIRHRAALSYGQSESSGRNSYETLLARARSSPPETKDCRSDVSAFVDWIFELDNYPHGRSPNVLYEIRLREMATRQLGKDAEPVMVANLVRDLKKQSAERLAKRKTEQKDYMVQRSAARYSKVGWTVMYNGTSGSEMSAMSVDRLTVNGIPLRARPDLVLQDIESGDVLVIEFKTWKGGKVLPRFGWANLVAQLWCYGYLQWPEWLRAPNKVFLQGQVWLTSNDGLTGEYCPLAPWGCDDPQKHSECLQLFEAYGGKWQGDSSGKS